MSPEKESAALRIFLQIFNDSWLRAYEVLASEAISDAKNVNDVESQIEALPPEEIGFDGMPIDESLIMDPFKDAKSFFLVFWNVFKYECTRGDRRIYLTQDEALNLLSGTIPCHEIWEGIIRNDIDFEIFAKRKRHDEDDNRIALAKLKKQTTLVSKMERIKAATGAIERNLVISSNATLEISRLKKPFGEELENVIKELEAEGIFASPRELSEIISNLYPHIPHELHLLLNTYISRLSEVKKNPKPKLKEQIIQTPEKPFEIQIPGFDIDPTTFQLKHKEKSFTFSPAGLRDAFDAMAGIDIYSPLDFAQEFKSLLDKIHDFCQKRAKIPGLIKMIYKLHKHYEIQWNKSNKQSMDGMKLGLIYTTLGLKHADLADDYIDPSKRPEYIFKKPE